MIYLLSDPHGGEAVGELDKYLRQGKENDLLIILGDVGLHFEDNERNRAFDSLLLSSQKKIAFLDGNHENFDFIYSHPKKQMWGGTVHELTPNVIHLMRGNIYDIEGKSFFVFGGCKSSEKWKEIGLWSPLEAPTEKELALAYANLRARDFKVDYVLTHKYETGKGTVTESLLKLCEWIDQTVEFKHWYAGHWHKTATIDEKHSLIYNALVPIE